MKKSLLKILCFSVILMSMTSSAFADFEGSVSAHSAILYCSDNKEPIYKKNAGDRMLIASITKIMTAIVVIENADLDEVIKIKPEWCAVEGSSMYLDYTKTYSIRELLEGMLIVSGNDAATALACHISGDERSFSAKMNGMAKKLGMKNSSFRNPHGLDDAEHYSTAEDMAILTDYCMKNEEFRSIVSSYSKTVKDNTYYNHNKLLLSYEGCIGVKTGYTMAAGRTLVSCAEREGLRLVCVTLNAQDDWNDHKKLLDYGFSLYTLVSYSSENFSVLVPTLLGEGQTKIVPREKLRLVVERDDKIDIRLTAPRILFYGGVEGEKLGEIQIYKNGSLAAKEDLVYTDSKIGYPADNAIASGGLIPTMLRDINPLNVGMP